VTHRITTARGARIRERRADVLLATIVTAVVLGPVLLRRGFALRGDMVFVPDQPWKDAWLGLDGAPPRSVPMDAVVWALGLPLSGDVVQKVLLAAILLGAGVGIARLVAGFPLAARAAAVVAFVWNPWVDQRLAIGQWAIVAGYAVLPWVVLAARRVGTGPPSGWPGLVVALGVAAVTGPASALMAGAVAAVVLLAGRHARALVPLAAVWLLVNLPWLVPAWVGPDTDAAAGGQFAGFAARGESELGLVPSLLGLGGIWKESVVPAVRTEPLVVGLAALLSLAAVGAAVVALRPGPPRAPSRLGRAGVAALLVLAVGALVLAALPAVPGVAAALDRGAGSVPALGILRDSHRFLAPAALLVAVGAALLVRWLIECAARPGREGLVAIAWLLVLWPVLCLPTLAWGRTGWLAPVDYPQAWSDVSRELAGERDTVTVVLPWQGSYRGFDWNDDRAMLDPAPRLLPGEVLVDDRVFLDDRTLSSEQPRLDAVRDALAQPDPGVALAGLGVTHVLVEDQPGATDVALDGTTLVAGSGLTLVRLAEPAAATAAGIDGLARAVVVAGDLVAVVTVAAGVGALGRRRMYALR
jgi:hypothetical protein